MGTRTIGLREDVYDRLKARKRDDESFTDLVDRLIDESSTDWRETFGSLPSAEADELVAAVERSRRRTGRGLADRQAEALAAFAEASDREDAESEPSDGN